jgi:hypothetical protein
VLPTAGACLPAWSVSDRPRPHSEIWQLGGRQGVAAPSRGPSLLRHPSLPSRLPLNQPLDGQCSPALQPSSQRLSAPSRLAKQPLSVLLGAPQPQAPQLHGEWPMGLAAVGPAHQGPARSLSGYVPGGQPALSLPLDFAERISGSGPSGAAIVPSLPDVAGWDDTPSGGSPMSGGSTVAFPFTASSTCMDAAAATDFMTDLAALAAPPAANKLPARKARRAQPAHQAPPPLHDSPASPALGPGLPSPGGPEAWPHCLGEPDVADAVKRALTTNRNRDAQRRFRQRQKVRRPPRSRSPGALAAAWGTRWPAAAAPPQRQRSYTAGLPL